MATRDGTSRASLTLMVIDDVERCADAAAPRDARLRNASGLALRLRRGRQLSQDADDRDQDAKEHDLFHVRLPLIPNPV
jgi:hypothetical protein